MRNLVGLFTFLGMLAVLSCGPGGLSLDEPPDIRIGEDVCDHCHMIISDERFASAYRTVDGTDRRFDDIGDMAAYHAIHNEEVARFWVHDVETLEWVEASMAWYVSSEEIMSPMGHGLAAYKAEESARAAAAALNGVVMTWTQVHSRASQGP